MNKIETKTNSSSHKKYFVIKILRQKILQLWSKEKMLLLKEHSKNNPPPQKKLLEIKNVKKKNFKLNSLEDKVVSLPESRAKR